jgi:hypothetical protein
VCVCEFFQLRDAVDEQIAVSDEFNLHSIRFHIERRFTICLSELERLSISPPVRIRFCIIRFIAISLGFGEPDVFVSSVS